MANKTITFGADLLPNSTAGSYNLGNSTQKWQINGVVDPKLTDTTYSTGTTSSSGLTKLYTSTGTATDGTMTQAAIKSALDGKANSSHGNHVPVTETANNAKFLRNDNTWQTVTPANIGAAASSHDHSASNITSGTLPIARGGTGATTAEAARANLGIIDEIVYGTTAPTSSTTGSIYIQTT